MLLAAAARTDPDGLEVHPRPRDTSYVGTIVASDAVAAALPQPFMLGASPDLVSLAAAMAMAPLGPLLVAPFVHGLHGRGGAAAGSAFFWAATGVASMGSAVLLLAMGCSDATSSSCQPDPGRLAASMILSASLVGAMILADAELARGQPVKKRPRDAFVPSVFPLYGGAGVGLGACVG